MAPFPAPATISSRQASQAVSPSVVPALRAAPTPRWPTALLTLTASVSGRSATGPSVTPVSPVVQIGNASTLAGDDLALIAGTGSQPRHCPSKVTPATAGDPVALGGTNTAGTKPFSGNIGLAKDVTVTAASGGTVAFGGDISGAGGLHQSGRRHGEPFRRKHVHGQQAPFPPAR